MKLKPPSSYPDIIISDMGLQTSSKSVGIILIKELNV
jgi:hypothetical protein